MLLPLGESNADLPCGQWFALEDCDLVCYDAHASPLLQEQIKLHELSHLLCGHRGVIDEAMLRRVLPNLSAGLIQRKLRRRPVVMGRTSYNSGDEQEAEMLATLIAERAAAEPPRADQFLLNLTDLRTAHRQGSNS
ncbi:hypothetical protein [Streptacidiphilus sp. MAP12-20]|uniref:hypothetical protein n=1 Tax=Streptacidiphilus sp. MAP12-20 TaxID=3156299 RepID=UPI00351882ED